MASTIVSERFVQRLTAEPSFFRAFPEFKGLEKSNQGNDRKSKSAGCRRCGRGRKPEKRALQGFISVLRSLPEDRLKALKTRASVQQFQFHGYNHTRRASEVMTR